MSEIIIPNVRQNEFLISRCDWLYHEMSRRGYSFNLEKARSLADLEDRVFVRAEPCRDGAPPGDLFEPQYGQMGSYGVFFGDNPHSLMHHNICEYYLVRGKDIIDPTFPVILFPSDDYTRYITKIADEEHCNFEKLGDCLKIDEIVHKNRIVYDTRSGVLTVPFPLRRNVCERIETPR